MVARVNADALTGLANRVMMAAIPGPVLSDDAAAWLADGLGGVVLFGGNVESPDQLRRLTATITATGDRPLTAVDEEGGDVSRLHHQAGSDSPGNLALGRVDDVVLTEAVAADIGRQLRDAGITVDLAPSVDVNTNAANPVIGTRSFGSDPELVARHAIAYVRGLHSVGMIACAKHFPGHGDTSVDSHFGLPRVDGDLEPHLVPFRAAMAAGVDCVLTAHIVFGALDDHPATLSRRIVTDLLRAELGFDGLVISDSMTMRAVADTYGLDAAGVRAIRAGVDMLCVNSDIPTQLGMRDALVAAVRSGDLSEARLAEAAGRVSRLAATPSPADGTRPSPGVGMEAARRALVVTGAGLPITEPLFVVELAGPRRGVDSQAGSLLAALRRLDPEADGEQLRGDAATPQALQAALHAGAGRRLVVVIRDGYHDHHQRQALKQLGTAVPDLLLVGLGMPNDEALAGSGGFLGTCGAARVNLLAAAEALLGRQATY
jgi:beta-N-acetylhexosaminidase